MTIHARLSSRWAGSVFVRVGFERTLYATPMYSALASVWYHSAKPSHHKSGYLLIKLLGKHFNRDRVAALVGRQVGEFLIKEVNLRQYLVGKRTVHDTRRMTRRIPQVDQTALRKQQQVVIAGCIANDFVHLGFDLFPLPGVAHVSGVNFVIEVTDVADHSPGLQRAEHRCGTDIEIAGRRDQQVSGR